MPTGPPRKGHQPATSEVQSSVHCPQSFDAEEFSVFVFPFRLQTTISTELCGTEKNCVLVLIRKKKGPQKGTENESFQQENLLQQVKAANKKHMERAYAH
jgi:hypothetical protein